MKKLITGGSGLIGSEFTTGVKISSRDYNLLEESEVIRMFQENQPEIVIHTAAKVGGLGANMRNNAGFFYENVRMNSFLIHQAKQFHVQRLVCFLSTCIFPDHIKYPLREDQIHEGPPHPSNYGYAYAKRLAEIQVRAYNEQYHSRYFCVIPTNVYGKMDNFNLDNAHVIPALIHKCYLAKLHHRDLVVWGTGNALREFIYSKDVAELTDLLLEKYDGTEPVLISPSYEVSIRELVELICRLMDFKNRIVFETSKPDGQIRKPSTNQKLLSIVGDYKFTTLEEGLGNTIEYFCSNYNSVRK